MSNESRAFSGWLDWAGCETPAAVGDRGDDKQLLVDCGCEAFFLRYVQLHHLCKGRHLEGYSSVQGVIPQIECRQARQHKDLAWQVTSHDVGSGMHCAHSLIAATSIQHLSNRFLCIYSYLFVSYWNSTRFSKLACYVDRIHTNEASICRLYGHFGREICVTLQLKVCIDQAISSLKPVRWPIFWTAVACFSTTKA